MTDAPAPTDPPPTFRVRVPGRVRTQLDVAMEDPDRAEDPDYIALEEAFAAKPPRADGSTHISLPETLLGVLYDVADLMVWSNQDVAGTDPDARADMNAGRVMLRALDKAGYRPHLVTVQDLTPTPDPAQRA